MNTEVEASYQKYLKAKKAYLEKKGGVTDESPLCASICVKQGSFKGEKKIGEECRCACQCESMKCDKNFSLNPFSKYGKGECKEPKKGLCNIL